MYGGYFYFIIICLYRYLRGLHMLYIHMGVCILCIDMNICVAIFGNILLPTEEEKFGFFYFFLLLLGTLSGVLLHFLLGFFFSFLSSACGAPLPAPPFRLTHGRLEPLWLLLKVNEDVIGRDASEGDGKANPGVDRVRVQRHEDHEEARDAEDHRDEERHLCSSDNSKERKRTEED